MTKLFGNRDFDTLKRDNLINDLVTMSLHCKSGLDMFVSIAPHVQSISVSIHKDADYQKDGNQNRIYDETIYFNRTDAIELLIKTIEQVRAIIRNHSKKLNHSNTDVQSQQQQLAG